MNDEWEEQFDEAYEELTSIHDVTAQRDTLKQRAADAHPILIALAQEGEPGDEEEPTRTRPTTEYGTLANQIGSNATYIWKVLVAIDKIGSRVGDPPVSPLVERASLVGPRHDYFGWDHLVDTGFEPDDDRAGLPDRAKREWRKRLREAYEHDEWHWTG
ncbi:hypothetical protein EKH57_08915 [Halorubrum sp. BOL3-1]|uniref:hypothetical protein n=1 Tax=Halorubrum sp. BOL3-1 TaxID=2497325 RepID=UPI001004E6C7|nr:hypothetical protein [Halorubrum sp. BOL3-1]QAU12838.1 hypothetical protein EKH57_08915 [Halorubrum sp. BOL3-1]